MRLNINPPSQMPGLSPILESLYPQENNQTESCVGLPLDITTHFPSLEAVTRSAEQGISGISHIA